MTIKEKIEEKLRGKENRVRRVLIAVGAAGILMIGLSEWLPSCRQKEVPGAPRTLTATQVETALEERITALVSEIDGVGSCRVMVTLEHGVQFVYATDQTLSKAGDTSSGSEKTLIVETDSGPVGLLVTELQPVVKGVVVVCAGGDDPAVCERVTAVISTAFDMVSRRVCVVKQQSK